MKHRAIIVTTDKATLSWKTLEPKRLAVEGMFNSMKNADFTVEVKHCDFSPEVINGRITERSFNTISHPLLAEGFDFVLIHFSRKQWLDLKLQPTLRGAAQHDADEVAEAYFWAEEHSLRHGLDHFVQVAGHEASHLFCHGSKTKDETHTYHTANKNIAGIFKTYDMAAYQPERFALKARLGFLQGLLQRLKSQDVTLLHPVEKYRQMISQPYGIKSSLYPKTGRHLGTDYATPVGTHIQAPFNGKITTAGTGKATGNFCHYEYTFNGKVYEERWCHLQSVPEIGSYKRGDVVAVTGNTGMSTGAHLHREVWANDVRVDLITKDNWSALTIDPETL